MRPDRLVAPDVLRLRHPGTQGRRRHKQAAFRAALQVFGTGRFGRFYELADCAADIATERPFYPARGVKGVTRGDLRKVLGDAAFAPRVCDRLAGAGPIFWLVGPRQVGRSAACIWRDLIAPRLDRVALWPFDGPLTELLAGGRPVVAEMYPAFLLRTLGVAVARKSERAARAACGRELLRRVGADARLDLASVRALLVDGFGATRSGEDPFDATITKYFSPLVARNRYDGQLSKPTTGSSVQEKLSPT